MALFDGIKRQLRSVIEWENPGRNMLFYRWTDNGDEIKRASKLIVGPGQGCIFVYEGKVEGVFTEEAMIDLKTDNIPFWTTVSRSMQFFKSEHQAGLYFFRKTKILDRKWGTKSAVKYIDPRYHFPVGLRAYGNFSFRITEPAFFFVNIVGGANYYTAENFREVMCDRMLQPITDFLAKAKYSYGDIDANREEIAGAILLKIAPEFVKLGFEITDFRIEGTNFDEETMKRINRIADVAADGHAASGVGLDYTRLQQLDALKDAAKNEGGAAGMGLGVGAGIGFGQFMAESMKPANTDDQPPGRDCEHVSRLESLKKMLDKQLITEEEYAARKKEILDRL